jgi:MFS transporter, MHS family, proline/betaine transporter
MALIEAKLSKEQSRAFALLSIGSVLEYFDLMLYVHMAVILNDIFFPQSGYFSKAQIAAFSFWSTYALRPLGAMFFTRIADKVGRKAAVIFSATIMAVCCLTLASLPPYQKIGIIAPIVLTLCRMVQGVSARSEIMQAQIYLAESIKPPMQYPLVSSMYIFANVGSICAIAIGSFFVNTNLFPKAWANDAWRFAFVIGAAIAIVGAVARNRLKASAAFADRQRAFKEHQEKVVTNFRQDNLKVSLNTTIAYFFMDIGHPALFFMIYIYFGGVLKETFKFSNLMVIQNNLWVWLVSFGATWLWSHLSYKFPPLRLVRVKAIVFFCLIVNFPLIMQYSPSPEIVLAFQCLITTFYLGNSPAAAILFKHFLIVKRSRYIGRISSIAKSGGYFVGPICVVLATDKFGYKGLWTVFVPITILFFVGLRYFEKKEIEESLLQHGPSLNSKF